MAAITFETKLRPCLVDGKKSLFHCWCHVSEIVCPSVLQGGHNGGVVATTLGLVENEKGDVRKVYPERITFLDNGIFQDYDFTRADGQIMTPEQFRDKMAEIYHEWWIEKDDEEAGHIYMDALMMDILIKLGYGDGVDIFKNAKKWYA